MTSGTARTAPLVLLRTWLLPLAVGAAAIGVHYAIHVPAGPLPPPSPAELEADKKAADKKKKADAAAKREADRKAGKDKPRPARSGVRDLAYEPFRRPRPAHIIEQLWAYYEPMVFKKEPTFEAWQTAHKPLLAQIVDAARHTAMPDAPVITIAANECHTIRCRFSITAPTQETLDAMIPVLRQLRLGDGPLWHSFEAGTPAADKDKKGAAVNPPRFKVELTVSFTRDLPTLAEISLPEQGPLRVQPPPSHGPIPAAGQLPTTTTGALAPSTSRTASKPGASSKPPKPPRSTRNPAAAEPSPG
jgi:hypothetical protein